jgi:hypothetical protein
MPLTVKIPCVLLLFALCAVATSCVVYEPHPAYYNSASTYDRAWSAALGALQDSGVTVTSTDASTGVIRGSKEGMDVSVSVVRQADGRTKVQFDSRNSQRDPALASRFSEAYERRMGR